MKKIIFFPILLVSFFLESCKRHKVETTHSVHISLVGDETDPHLLLPEADPIIALYDFDVDIGKEAFFRLSTITDKQLNPVIEYNLPLGSVTEKNNIMEDMYYREKLVLSFYNNIRKAILGFTARRNSDSSLNHSECFLTIAEELRLMQNKKAERDILLVYSDLMEKSNLFDCYTKAGQEMLYKRPDEIIKLFNDTHLLPDSLKGIEVIFVYQPATREDDQNFRAMVEVYSRLLELRGAKVKVQANNNYFN